MAHKYMQIVMHAVIIILCSMALVFSQITHACLHLMSPVHTPGYIGNHACGSLQYPKIEAYRLKSLVLHYALNAITPNIQ